ncbi:retrovirus-related pol polyprotein from transposon TNT 1-94 [Tanacetum coccineum]
MLTRSMVAKLTASSASECLFADFISKIEPKKVSEALKHPGWVDAMQEEMNQNKKDEHGITTKNKARLVAQGYSQEEEIDYDETFALVARMEAIRIFLAFATYMNFKVYQMDVKSAFLNGKLKEEVYVKQPTSFESSEFPDYVCKLDKALYGLKQAPKACSLVKTPMVPPNNLGPDLAGKPVCETSYKGMIGSLMYLTTTRPDIQFSIVLCARYQSNPKESHLTAVKRILKYGTPTIGLYYPKCTGFDLKGYSNSDYAGCNMDRKSTLAEAEYVAAAGCCASILWMKSLLSDYDIHYKMEFWSTAIAYDPNPPSNDSMACPLKEFLIKFSVMNSQSFTLDFNTFRSSTGLDYNKGKYVAHPTPEVVKTELGKIATNASYLDKTPVLKNSFPMAWRILFTFVIQVLGGNYSSTKHINSIQQMIAYCIITGTEVTYPSFISCALEVLLGSAYTQDQKKKKKVKSETVTSTLPQSQGPEASGTLPQKRKKPKSKKTPTKTKVTPPPSQRRVFEQSHSVSSGTIPDPQDPKRNIQLAGTRLPSTLDEGPRKSQPLSEGVAKTTPFPEGARGDKDSEGLKPLFDMEPQTNPVADLLGTGAEYQVDETQSTRLRYLTLTKNKGKTSSKVEPGLETLQLTTLADTQESGEEEVFVTEDDMEEDTQADEEERQSLTPNKDKPEPFHIPGTQVSDSDSSSHNLKKYDNILPLTKRQLVKYLRKVSRVLFKKLTEEQWTQHEEDVVSYVDLKASIEGYYEENVDHREQTDKVIDAVMKSLDKNSIVRGDLLNALNGVTKTLKVIQDAVKEDLILNKKVIEATEAYTKNFTHLTKLLTLINNFDFQGLKSLVDSIHATALS